MSNRMNILITGGTGFVGKRLVKKLKESNNITVISRGKSFDKYYVCGDLKDYEQIEGFFKNIDVVIHLAFSKDYLENLDITKNVIIASKENHVKKIIFVSSMAVKRNRLDDYGKNKKALEKMIINSKIPYVILRPSVIYSKNSFSLIEMSFKFPIFIPIIGDGNYKLNPVFIQDLIEVIKRTLKKDVQNKIYDVSGSESISFNEVIDLYSKRKAIHKIKMHIPLFLCLLIFKIFPIISQEAIKGINQNTTADSSSLKKDLKVSPISFREGVTHVNI